MLLVPEVTTVRGNTMVLDAHLAPPDAPMTIPEDMAQLQPPIVEEDPAATSLQIRFDRLTESAGRLVDLLHDKEGRPLSPQAGDFTVASGRLALHGLLVDEQCKFSPRSEVLRRGDECYRVFGHLVTSKTIYRHIGQRFYTRKGQLAAHGDILKDMVPNGRLGELRLHNYLAIENAVFAGENVARDLGNRFRVELPVHDTFAGK